MLRRRRRSPALATIPSVSTAAPGALPRAQLAAYRMLLERTTGSRVVLLAGTGRAEVAVGLATAAAAAGRRTALVECELSSPTLAARLGLAERPGLAEYLRGEAAPRDLIQPLLLAGPGGGGEQPLVCIVAGEESGEEAAEALAGERLGHAIAKLRNGYELVVVAAPSSRPPGALVAVLRHVDLSLAVVSPGERPPAAIAEHADAVVELEP